MFQRFHELAAEGLTQREIASLLHLDRHTVRKYLRTDQLVDHRHRPFPSLVEPYRAYLEKRWTQGCTMISVLWSELQAQGIKGGYHSVWLFPTTGLFRREQTPTAEKIVPTPAIFSAFPMVS
ncbi:MAG: hypothetical protein J2P36_00320 [Ktedonobacteraceae bacterium]|nr:hypothetical protein [Ktedonobacteraceae bacterium]